MEIHHAARPVREAEQNLTPNSSRKAPRQEKKKRRIDWTKLQNWPIYGLVNRFSKLLTKLTGWFTGGGYLAAVTTNLALMIGVCSG
jgi:hypothetical protein